MKEHVDDFAAEKHTATRLDETKKRHDGSLCWSTDRSATVVGLHSWTNRELWSCIFSCLSYRSSHLDGGQSIYRCHVTSKSGNPCVTLVHLTVSSPIRPARLVPCVDCWYTQYDTNVIAPDVRPCESQGPVTSGYVIVIMSRHTWCNYTDCLSGHECSLNSAH